MQAQPPFFKLMEGEKEIEIPFELLNDFILIKVKFKGYIPLNLIFDTGATNTIFFKKELTEIFNMPYDDNVRIYGSDLSNEVIAKVCRRVPFHLDGIGNYTQDILVLQENFFDLDKVTGYQIDGILGATIFKDYVFKIDYVNHMITVTPHPYSQRKLTGYTKVDIQLSDNKPYLSATTRTIGSTDPVTLNYLLDTGAAVSLLIHQNTSDSIYMPQNLINGVIGKGLGGDLQGFLGKIDRVNMDKFFFSNLVVSFQDIDTSNLKDIEIVRNGIIGNILISRFSVIFDYRNEVVYLKPRNKYNKKFKTDKSGLIIFAHGRNLDNYIIHRIIPESPADQAGLKEGDIIKTFQRLPTSMFSLQDINRKLQSRNGKKIRFIVIRDGEKKKVKFKLKDMFG